MNKIGTLVVMIFITFAVTFADDALNRTGRPRAFGVINTSSGPAYYIRMTQLSGSGTTVYWVDQALWNTETKLKCLTATLIAILNNPSLNVYITLYGAGGAVDRVEMWDGPALP